MKKLTLFAALLALLAAGCDQMYDQASVRPYEEPLLPPPEGTMATDSGDVEIPTPEQMAAMVEDGRVAYRRYCWACHGPEMDGKGTVGPSFPRDFESLTSPDVAELEDIDLYQNIGMRMNMHPPLASTMTPEERWQVVAYIRAVQRGLTEPGAPEENEKD